MPGLYIHIPFCMQKCLYCDFYSESCYNDFQVDAFLSALEKELSQIQNGFAPRTVFFGGGTPTALSANQLKKLIFSINRNIDLSKVEEWSVEANPGTLDAEKMEVLCVSGVNRFSIGVQSFNDDRLNWLGRIHRAKDVYSAVELIKSFGIKNFNIDLMHSIPGDSLEDWRDQIEKAIELNPTHISCYNLTFEEGTSLTRKLESGEFDEPSEELQLAQFELTDMLLSAAGFGHYEISNYSKPGQECRHNLLYWQGGEYIGCGPSAHSHLAGRRFSNAETLNEYISLIDEKGSAFDFEEFLSAEERACETLVFGLRLLDGVNRTSFKAQTGFDFYDLRGAEISKLEEVGLLEFVNENLRLTRSGLFVSNSVFAELI